MPKAKYSLLRVMVRDDMMEWLRDRAVTATDERGRYIYVSEVVREALSRYRSTEQENMPALVIRKAGTQSAGTAD
jgi:Arc/MetJ-type ribon-helix-helix transcriptional regulator